MTWGLAASIACALIASVTCGAPASTEGTAFGPALVPVLLLIFAAGAAGTPRAILLMCAAGLYGAGAAFEVVRDPHVPGSARSLAVTVACAAAVGAAVLEVRAVLRPASRGRWLRVGAAGLILAAVISVLIAYYAASNFDTSPLSLIAPARLSGAVG